VTPAEGFRLSPGQRYLWSTGPDIGRYSAHCSVWIDGPLDDALLVRALDDVVARHEILRTSLVELPGLGIPVQSIRSNTGVQIARSDCSQRESSIQAACIDRIVAAIPQTVANGSTLGAHCLRLSPDRHALVLGATGLCADATTMNLVADEVAERYEALTGSSPDSERESPSQYADLAEWLNLLLESPDVAAARQWWEHHGGFPSSSGASSFRPASLDVMVSASVAASLSLSRLLACVQILTWRMTGQAATCTGVGVNGRAASQLAGALGPFTRYVPVHSSIEPDVAFDTLAERADELIRESAPRAHFLPYPPPHYSWPIVVDAIDVDGLDVGTRWTVQSIGGRYDRARIRLSYVRAAGNALRLEYDGSVVTENEARRWCERIQTVLEQVADSPGLEVRSLNVTGPAERSMIAGWNSGRTLDTGCIDEWFQQTVTANRDRIAVVAGGQRMTYGALDAWTSEIAADLQRGGVKPDTVVGLRTGRTLELVAGLLGILKSGAAYLPLEPQLPAIRLSHLLDDCALRQILVDLGGQDEIPAWPGELIVISRPVPLGGASTDVVRRATPNNLAYVIYTSGSTGRPKGVAVEHRHVTHYLRGMLERMSIPPQATFATVSSFAMDLGNTAIYLSLCTGGTLHVISRDCASNPDAFREYLHANPIDVLKIVPSHLESLIALNDPALSLPRRFLILGGEAPAPGLLARIAGAAPDLVVVNHYGPTETTIGAATFQIPFGVHFDESPPIGRPLPGASIHVLDERLQPVPIGAPGELYIGGGSVARGYMNLSSLTAERFVTGPLELRGRMYRTGDRGRYLDDGNVQFLGRSDDQLKIRGFRVEPGEVEAIVCGADGVRKAVVLGIPREAPDHLVAYVVTDASADWRRDRVRLDALRAFLADRLPDHMIPLEIIVLDELPLTANGKIDRHRLSALDGAAHARDRARTPPGDSLEVMLAAIWEDVLHVRPIGVTDNFFQLGGHSLLAVRLLARLRQEVDPTLALTTLLQAPSVRSLAAAMRGSATLRPSPLVPIQPHGSAPPLFCVHGGWGDVMCYARLAEQLGSDQPFFGLQAIDDAGSSVEDLARVYLDAMIGKQPRGPYRLGGWSFGGIVAYEMAHQLRVKGDEVQSLILFDAMPPGSPAANLDRVLAEIRGRLEVARPWLADPESTAEGGRWVAAAARRARSHHEMLLAYAPPACDVPLLLLHATDRFEDQPYDAVAAWRRLVPGPFDEQRAGGNHLTMLEEPHVDGVATAVRSFFARSAAPLARVVGR
jgi:amino acid adenylation domain-containing protein